MSVEEIRPGGRMIDITAADTDIAKHRGKWPRAIYVGTGGTVKIMDAEGNISTWIVPSGYRIDGQVRQVMSTGTVTATAFVAIY